MQQTRINTKSATKKQGSVEDMASVKKSNFAKIREIGCLVKCLVKYCIHSGYSLYSSFCFYVHTNLSDYKPVQVKRVGC